MIRKVVPEVEYYNDDEWVKNDDSIKAEEKLMSYLIDVLCVSIRHNLAIDGCGCCNSPYVSYRLNNSVYDADDVHVDLVNKTLEAGLGYWDCDNRVSKNGTIKITIVED